MSNGIYKFVQINMKHLLYIFLTVQWVGLQCVMVEFPGRTYLLLFGLRSSLFKKDVDTVSL